MFREQSFPFTDLIHLDTGIYPETGKRMFRDEKKPLYKKLKLHPKWNKLTRYQKRLAKNYIKRRVKVIIYEFEEVEKAINYALLRSRL